MVPGADLKVLRSASPHVIVLGRVIGTTTAYFTRPRHGISVTVIDRQPGRRSRPAMPTPARSRRIFHLGRARRFRSRPSEWLFQRHAPLAIRADGSLFQLKWMAEMLKNFCSAERYAVNKGA